MRTLNVSELNAQIKSLLETTFIQVSVAGEVKNLTTHTSGHLYFTLKDKDSSLRCVMFRGNASRLKFQIQDGMSLTLNGTISVYVPRGDYQLNCLSASPNGVGELTLAYEQLKEMYQKKGYFENKKPLPKFPQKIALLTSKTGAVLHDMLSVAQKRWNLVEFVLLNTLVQGESAKESIAKNIEIADALRVDCIVIARGGGSIEDLWAFNEVPVIEAIFKAQTPIVSAIGHEPDVVLSDFVADLRAPTPSAAMEMILPDKNEWLMNLDMLQNDLEEKLQRIFATKSAKLHNFYNFLNESRFFLRLQKLDLEFKSHQTLLAQRMEQCLMLNALKMQTPSAQIEMKMQQIFARFQARLNAFALQLEAKNPQNFRKNGYVYAMHLGCRIKSLEQLKPKDILELEDSSAVAKVEIKEIRVLEHPNNTKKQSPK